jgi:hypothetical protein
MTAALQGGEWLAARLGRNLPPRKNRYPFYRRLGGPQVRSGKAENLVPTGIRSRTVQPVAQSLYRLSYRAHNDSYVKVKVKWSCYRPGVAQRVGRVIALLFHDRGTRRRWVVSSTPRPHFTPAKDPVPIFRRLDGPQVRSGGAENLVPTGIRSRTVQPVITRYTDWATRPVIFIYIKTQFFWLPSRSYKKYRTCNVVLNVYVCLSVIYIQWYIFVVWNGSGGSVERVKVIPMINRRLCFS